VENLINKDITELLPHRKPFLFIDKVILLEGANKIVAEKKINKDEDYLKGHFPGKPIVPGVLIVESMAQASGLIAAYSIGELKGVYYLSRISDIKFKHPVFPGDTLIIKAEVLGHFGQAVKTRAYCEVNGRVVAEGELVLSKMEGERK
jgi:3-hydroxyacyl-[acyl-carrier-protein] dehydratase